MKLKNNKKGEFRIQHLFIAVLLFSLFSVILFSESTNFVQNVDSSVNLSTGDNVTDMFMNDFNILDETRTNVAGISDKSPGGQASTSPGEDDTTEGSLQKSGLGVVAAAGVFLYSVPTALLGKVATFLDINPLFVTAATTIIILIIAIILVSSILRNRL